MKRIVLVVPTFPRLSETFIASKFMALAARGWDVRIACTESPASEWAHFPELQEAPEYRKRVRLSWPHRPAWLAVVLWPAMFLMTFFRRPKLLLRYIFRGLRMFGLDIFRRLYLDHSLLVLAPELIHFEFGALAVGRTYLKELLGCRLSVSFRGHDLTFVGLDQPDYYRSLWQAVDGIHCLGTYLSDRAVERGCPADKPRTIIPPAISPEFVLQVQKPGNDSGRLHVLSVGRLTWVKDYETALLAVDRVRRAGIPIDYAIVGEGEEFEAVAYQIHQYGLGDTVRLCGALSPREVRAMLAEADVFVHSAVSEGFCNAVLEAQAAGVAVVCTDGGGLAENVVDGVTGFVVPRSDPEAMAEKIEQLASNPSLRRKMGLAGRKRAVKQFNLSKQIDAFERFYQQVLDGRERPH